MESVTVQSDDHSKSPFLDFNPKVLELILGFKFTLPERMAPHAFVQFLGERELDIPKDVIEGRGVADVVEVLLGAVSATCNITNLKAGVHGSGAK